MTFPLFHKGARHFLLLPPPPHLPPPLPSPGMVVTVFLVSRSQLQYLILHLSSPIPHAASPPPTRLGPRTGCVGGACHTGRSPSRRPAAPSSTPSRSRACSPHRTPLLGYSAGSATDLRRSACATRRPRVCRRRRSGEPRRGPRRSRCPPHASRRHSLGASLACPYASWSATFFHSLHRYIRRHRSQRHASLCGSVAWAASRRGGSALAASLRAAPARCLCHASLSPPLRRRSGRLCTASLTLPPPPSITIPPCLCPLDSTLVSLCRLSLEHARARAVSMQVIEVLRWLLRVCAPDEEAALRPTLALVQTYLPHGLSALTRTRFSRGDASRIKC